MHLLFIKNDLILTVLNDMSISIILKPGDYINNLDSFISKYKSRNKRLKRRLQSIELNKWNKLKIIIDNRVNFIFNNDLHNNNQKKLKALFLICYQEENN
jgi:hypothetical protein